MTWQFTEAEIQSERTNHVRPHDSGKECESEQEFYPASWQKHTSEHTGAGTGAQRWRDRQTLSRVGRRALRACSCGSLSPEALARVQTCSDTPVLALRQALRVFIRALEVASFSLGSFSLYSTFHTCIGITFLKSRCDPGPACFTACVLLLPVGSLQTFLYLSYYQQPASLPLSCTLLVLWPRGTTSPVKTRSAQPAGATPHLHALRPFLLVEWPGSVSAEDPAKPRVPRPHCL